MVGRVRRGSEGPRRHAGRPGVDQPDVPVREGFPTYVPAARAFIVLVNPDIGGFQTGNDVTGNGSALNVRALSLEGGCT